MFFVDNSWIVFNFIVIIIRYVSTEDSQDLKIKPEDLRARQENNFDYWEIDHSEASAIYYEPADLFKAKPFELIKNFFISNPRTIPTSTYSIDKTHSSTAKEKRNSLSQNTDKNELCVNDTVLDEGTNLLLDLNLASSAPLRNSDSKELTTEYLDIEDIQSTEQKLEECIDLHLFKNKGVIENWQVFLLETKMQIYSKLDEKDIDKEILKKCKHLDDIIEKNLDLLKRSMPRRNKDKDSSVEGTAPKVSLRTNKLLTKEVKYVANPDESISSQTANPLDGLSTESNILTSQYKHGVNSIVERNFSGLNEQPITINKKNKTKARNITSSKLPTENLSRASLNELRNIDENYPYRRSNTLESQPKRNRGNGMAYQESDYKIPKILTKELLNGSVISEANGTETLPNDDFKDLEIAENETIQTFKDNTVGASKFNISDTQQQQQLNEATTHAARASMINDTNFAAEPTTVSTDYFNSFSHILASTENTLAQEIALSKENNVSDSFNNISIHKSEKWLTENNLTGEVNTASTITKQVYESNTDKDNASLIAKQVYETTDDKDNASTIAKQVYETTTDKDDIPKASQDETLLSAPKETSSLDGTLFFDFNGDLVPTHFIQNAEGSINIAIDGKSFCDNVLKNHQSVILLAICKSDYVTSNTKAKINES